MLLSLAHMRSSSHHVQGTQFKRRIMEFRGFLIWNVCATEWHEQWTPVNAHTIQHLPFSQMYQQNNGLHCMLSQLLRLLCTTFIRTRYTKFHLNVFLLLSFLEVAFIHFPRIRTILHTEQSNDVSLEIH